jgi:hypothetical protein
MGSCITARAINLQTNDYSLYLWSFWHAIAPQEQPTLTITGNAFCFFGDLTEFYGCRCYPFCVPFDAFGLLPKGQTLKIVPGEYWSLECVVFLEFSLPRA